MSRNIGQRLLEVVDFEFSKPLSQKVREELTVKLCGQFLEQLTENIEKEGKIEDTGDVKVEDTFGIAKTMEDRMKNGKLEKTFRERNLQCYGVLPSDGTKHGVDLSVIAFFGFSKVTPKNLLARTRSRKILDVIEKNIDNMFPDSQVADVEHNWSAKVPYVLSCIDGVSVIIKILIKPFRCPQFFSKEVIEEYKKYDDRFLTLSKYFHSFLLSKVINRHDRKKANSVIPKLCSIELMFIHFFKHYNLLPAQSSDINLMMSRISLSPKPSTLGTLFFLFLDYYLNVISLETAYLEINTGDVIEKASIGLTNKNILSIGDIFDDHAPGERVNDIRIFMRILKAALNDIKKYVLNRTGDLLNDLRVIPLRPRIE